MFKGFVAAASAAFMTVGVGNAAIQEGGNASFEAFLDGTSIGDFGGVVSPLGGGDDIVASFLAFDVNAGSGDQLVATSTSNNWNWTNAGDPFVSLVFTLDLAPNTALVDFTLDTITFPNASSSVANNILTITFDDTTGGQLEGVWLSGTYEFADVAPVPGPAAALLFAPAALAAIRRRRRA